MKGKDNSQKICWRIEKHGFRQGSTAGVTRESGYRKPSTLRTAVFVGGAILGRKERDVVLRFSESWGGLKKHIPLIKEALNSGNPIAPLLPKPPGEREILDALACGGCAI